MKQLLKENDSGVLDGIMMWVTVAIILAILPTILYSVSSSTQLILAANSTVWNTTQAQAATGVSGGFNILLIVLPVLAVVIIIGVLAILRGRAR
jgi:flagellar biosynthesis protein FlhB